MNFPAFRLSLLTLALTCAWGAQAATARTDIARPTDFAAQSVSQGPIVCQSSKVKTCGRRVAGKLGMPAGSAPKSAYRFVEEEFLFDSGVAIFLETAVPENRNAHAGWRRRLAFRKTAEGFQLVQVGIPYRSQGGRRTAAALGTVLSAATVGVPTVLLGTLAVWPYALSVTCLPGVLVLALRLLRALPAGATDATDATDTADDGERERTASAPGPLAGTLLLVGAAGGAVLAHGAEAFNLMVLLVPLAAVLIARAVRAGGRRRRTALASLTAVAVVVLAGAWIMREALAGVLGYDRPGGSLPGTLGQALLDLPQYGPLASHGLPVGVVVCALAVVAAARVPRARPWLAAAALALCLVVVVGGPQWWGRQLGGPWYLQKARVQPLLIVPALVLAATGLDHLLRVRPGRRTLAVLTALVCAAAVGRLPLQADLVRSVHDADRIAYGTLVTPEEADFYASLGDRLPEDAVVVGAPSRGASYLLSLGGVDVVYPLRSDPTTGSAADLLAERAPDLRPGSTTCELLDEVGAEYYLRVDRAGTVWEERQAPVRWDRLVADWPTDGMEPVASTGTASLWRITACGS